MAADYPSESIIVDAVCVFPTTFSSCVSPLPTAAASIKFSLGARGVCCCYMMNFSSMKCNVLELYLSFEHLSRADADLLRPHNIIKSFRICAQRKRKGLSSQFVNFIALLEQEITAIFHLHIR
jgi:hypothetical protein